MSRWASKRPLNIIAAAKIEGLLCSPIATQGRSYKGSCKGGYQRSRMKKPATNLRKVSKLLKSA